MLQCETKELLELFFTPPCEDQVENDEEEKAASSDDEDMPDLSTENEDGLPKLEIEGYEDGTRGNDLFGNLDVNANEDESKVVEVREGEGEKEETQAKPENEGEGEAKTEEVLEPVEANPELDAPETAVKPDTTEEEAVETKEIEDIPVEKPAKTEETPIEKETEIEEDPVEKPINIVVTLAESSTESVSKPDEEPNEHEEQTSNSQDGTNSEIIAKPDEEEDEPKSSEDNSQEPTETSQEPGAEPEPEESSEVSTEVATVIEDPRVNDPNWENKHELLEYLMKFLDTDIELCPVLTGYFSKQITSLANKKGELFYPYLFEHANVLTWFAKHTYSKSITDVFSILLRNVDECTEVSQDLVKTKKADVIDILLSNLKSEDQDK